MAHRFQHTTRILVGLVCLACGLCIACGGGARETVGQTRPDPNTEDRTPALTEADTAPMFVRSVRVIASTLNQVRPDSACTLSIRGGGGGLGSSSGELFTDCQAELRCGDLYLFGAPGSGGYFMCVIAADRTTLTGRDARRSSEDGDASFVVDLSAGTLQLSDDEVSSFGAYELSASLGD